MRTRSSSNLVGNSSSNPTTSNPKRRNRRRSKQSFSLEESPIATMADQRTMAELLRAPTEGYAEAIVVPPILAEHFELKHSLINMMTSDLRKTILMTTSVARRWLEKEPPRSILTWEDLVSKFINEFFPPSRTTNLRNEISNFQQRFDESFHEAWDRYKDLLRGCPHHGFTELHQLAKLTHAVNQQTSAVTTAMTAILKQFQATPPSAFVKAVEEICVTCGGAHPYNQCLAVDGVANQTRPPGFVQQNGQNNQNRFSQPQGYNRGNNFNQNLTYQAPIQQNQNVHLNKLEKFKKTNEANMKAMQTQINNVKNELRNEMQNSIQASMSNQTNELKNMMASFFQMNTASTSGSGSLPSNTVANPKGELKAITTRSGLVLDGPSVPMPPPFINPEEDERVEETLTNPEHAVILKKLPKKLGDPGKFLIPCGFSELKCKALADLGASINLMPLSVWKRLGLPELIFTQMTLELANREICTPVGIARDVFVLVGKFTFPADFVIVNYESDPRVPLILGRPFLWNA
ncbi:reverse transcriptase domain-containing protein [Tanacetum coccineum]|uniref:Reverse transcriptase domain-containing protein n=1 Tax=Tanacetum coccineum TaxID=301880 RepID=A0ABQ5ASZ8_9ASTR